MDQLESESKRVELVNGIVYYKDRRNGSRIFPPASTRWLIIDFYHHECPHPSMNRTYDIVSCYFDWPCCREEVEDYCKTCEQCHRAKAANTTLAGPMQSTIAEDPNELLLVDLFGPLPKSVFGMSLIVIVMDVFTKHTKLYPIKSATANSCIPQVAKFIDTYGPAKEILTENGSQVHLPCVERLLCSSRSQAETYFDLYSIFKSRWNSHGNYRWLSQELCRGILLDANRIEEALRQYCVIRV